MTDQGLLSVFLFLHVGAAIIAFGPTFVFPLVGGFAGKEPMHGNFAARINEAIEDRIVLPFALSMPVTGIFLIYFAHFNLLDRSAWWLDLAILAYIVAIGISVVVQRPLVQKIVHLTTRPAAAPGAAPVGPPAGAPPGPPPGLLETTKAVQRNGQFLGVLLVFIVLMMVVKPQF